MQVNLQMKYSKNISGKGSGESCGLRSDADGPDSWYVSYASDAHRPRLYLGLLKQTFPLRLMRLGL